MGRPFDAAGNEVFQEYPKMLADGRIAQSAADEAGETYPKIVTVGGDKPVHVTVLNAEDEARWRAGDANPEGDAPIQDVLDDPDGAPPNFDDVSPEFLPEPEPEPEPSADEPDAPRGKSRKKK